MRNYQIIIVLLIIALFQACSQEESVEKLEKKLESYRKEAKQIELNIKELESQIEALSDGVDNRYLEPVVTQTLQPVIFKHFFEASGAIQPVKEAFISPEINGQISEVYVQDGDVVRQGQLLAKLNTEVTEKSIQEVESALALARDVFARQQRLWDQRIGSEIQYLEAKNNMENLEKRLATLKAQLDMSAITSPLDGYVEKVSQKKGELAAPGVVMMHLINLDDLFVIADVSERFLPAINQGDVVSLRFPSFPDYILHTEIDRVGNLINRTNRTFEVQLRIRNENKKLKPNMVAVININDYVQDNSLVVPTKIIREDLNGSYVYVAESATNGTAIARKRYIIPGRTYKGDTRIETGLHAGDAIIVEGFSKVNDGSLLRIL